MTMPAWARAVHERQLAEQLARLQRQRQPAPPPPATGGEPELSDNCLTSELLDVDIAAQKLARAFGGAVIGGVDLNR